MIEFTYIICLWIKYIFKEIMYTRDERMRRITTLWWVSHQEALYSDKQEKNTEMETCWALLVFHTPTRARSWIHILSSQNIKNIKHDSFIKKYKT